MVAVDNCIGGGGAQSANGASLGTLGDDLCFPCRGASGCIGSWDACPVLGSGEVRASTKTARQRFAGHFAELGFEAEIDDAIREDGNQIATLSDCFAEQATR